MEKELLEERKRLQEESAKYRKAIQEQFDSTVNRVEDAGKNILLAAGIAIVSYGFVRLLTSSSPKKVEVPAKIEENNQIPDQGQQYMVKKNTSPIIALIRDNLTNFAFTFMKEKLQDYLEKSIRSTREKNSSN